LLTAENRKGQLSLRRYFLPFLFIAALAWCEEGKVPTGIEKPVATQDTWFARFRILLDWQMANGFYFGIGSPKRPAEAELLWAKIGKNLPNSEYPDIASIIGLANLQIGNFPAAIKAFEKASVYYGPYFKNLDASRLSLVTRGSREDKCLVRILDKKGQPLGSGAYIWSDGLVLTAAHVINEKGGLLVQDFEGKTHEVLGVFPGNFNSDLAALKTKGPSPHYLQLAPGPFLQDDELQILGFPFGSAVSIRSTGRAGGQVNANVKNIRVVQCDLSSVPGYSGAPALELSGKITGVVSMCRTDNPYQKGKKQKTFLVSFEDLKDFLDCLKKEKRFSALGNSEWGKVHVYWSADWCKNDNLLAQALYSLKSDPEKGIELLEEAGDEGSSSAWLLLGRTYFLGEGVPQNIEKSSENFRRAAEMGEPVGLYMTGLFYLGGLGVERNKAKGYEYIKRAVDADNVQALIHYSAMYGGGIDVQKDRELSLYYSRRAAQTMEEAGINGHVSNLVMDENSASNREEMLQWCMILAQEGSPLGQYLLACCYLSGVGTEKDEAKAIGLLTSAAEQGEVQAYLQLCLVNFLGRGVEVNYEEAAEWAKKAAEAKIDKAFLFLFFCEAIPKEKSGEPVSNEARKNLETACEMGVPDAQFYYGQCLLEGLHGIERDYPKALKLFKQAREKGYEKAGAYVTLAQMEVDKEAKK
jgi:TPR repeat protein